MRARASARAGEREGGRGHTHTHTQGDRRTDISYVQHSKARHRPRHAQSEQRHVPNQNFPIASRRQKIRIVGQKVHRKHRFAMPLEAGELLALSDVPDAARVVFRASSKQRVFNGREHSLEYARLVSLEFTHSPRCFGRTCRPSSLSRKSRLPILAHCLGISPPSGKFMSISTACQSSRACCTRACCTRACSTFSFIRQFRHSNKMCPVSRPVTDEVSTI